MVRAKSRKGSMTNSDWLCQRTLRWVVAQIEPERRWHMEQHDETGSVEALDKSKMLSNIMRRFRHARRASIRRSAKYVAKKKKTKGSR
jgi:hypothetical protein